MNSIRPFFSFSFFLLMFFLSSCFIFKGRGGDEGYYDEYGIYHPGPAPGSESDLPGPGGETPKDDWLGFKLHPKQERKYQRAYKKLYGAPDNPFDYEYMSDKEKLAITVLEKAKAGYPLSEEEYALYLNVRFKSDKAYRKFLKVRKKMVEQRVLDLQKEKEVRKRIEQNRKETDKNMKKRMRELRKRNRRK